MPACSGSGLACWLGGVFGGKVVQLKVREGLEWKPYLDHHRSHPPYVQIYVVPLLLNSHNCRFSWQLMEKIYSKLVVLVHVRCGGWLWGMGGRDNSMRGWMTAGKIGAKVIRVRSGFLKRCSSSDAKMKAANPTLLFSSSSPVPSQLPSKKMNN